MIDHSFSSGQELLELCEVEQIPISEAAVLYELDRAEMDREAVFCFFPIGFCAKLFIFGEKYGILRLLVQTNQ